MCVDRELRWVILMRLSSRDLVLSQGKIMSARLKANAFDIAYLTGADTVLPFYVHDQGHSRNVAKCQNEIGME